VSNKERVLDAARVLFNDRGSGRVSTNHIAEAAGISPGNLYYHFRNKGEIIRELFERLFERWNETFEIPDGRASLADMESLIHANYELIWEYRFAYREMAVLTRDDPALAARYREMRDRGYEGFEALIDAFVAAGVMRPPQDREELAQLTDLCWLVSEQWPIDLELRGRPFDKRGVDDGARLLRSVLQPYLAPND